MKFKVFKQKMDHSFHEIANLESYVDARAVLNNYSSGIVTYEGVIVHSQNLTSEEDTPHLPIDYAAQP